jgi:hypothetical protein
MDEQRSSAVDYAASFWIKHVMEVLHGAERNTSNELWELLSNFFWRNDGAAFLEWIGMFNSEEENDPEITGEENASNEDPPWYDSQMVTMLSDNSRKMFRCTSKHYFY